MSRSYRTVVVINPHSAGGRTGRRWPQTARVIEAGLGHPFNARFTTRPGEATEVTRAALREGAELVISVGGDGTHNEVVNGFFDPGAVPINPQAIFSLVPSGTGGDFRKSIGLPKGAEAAAARLAGPGWRTIDLGHLQYTTAAGEPAERLFLNITSFGLGGVVDDYVNRTTKAFGGRLSFMVGTVRALLSYRNPTVRLRLDDHFDETLRINNVAVANGEYFGGGMHVAPLAKLDDGRFDVVVFGDISRARVVALSRTIYRGAHLSLPNVRLLHAQTVSLTSRETVLIDMDGEQPGRLPATARVLPGALRLKV